MCVVSVTDYIVKQLCTSYVGSRLMIQYNTKRTNGCMTTICYPSVVSSQVDVYGDATDGDDKK